MTRLFVKHGVVTHEQPGSICTQTSYVSGEPVHGYRFTADDGRQYFDEVIESSDDEEAHCVYHVLREAVLRDKER